jgi:hypothetical protein
MPFKDYTLREKEIQQLMSPLTSNSTLSKEEIAKQTLHVPKRLRGGPVALVNKLRKLHQKCTYMELLRHYCPVEVTMILLVPCSYLTFYRACIYPQDRTGGKAHFSLTQQFLQLKTCNATREMMLPNLNARWKTLALQISPVPRRMCRHFVELSYPKSSQMTSGAMRTTGA